MFSSLKSNYKSLAIAQFLIFKELYILLSNKWSGNKSYLIKFNGNILKNLKRAFYDTFLHDNGWYRKSSIISTNSG